MVRQPASLVGSYLVSVRTDTIEKTNYLMLTKISVMPVVVSSQC